MIYFLAMAGSWSVSSCACQLAAWVLFCGANDDYKTLLSFSSGLPVYNRRVGNRRADCDWNVGAVMVKIAVIFLALSMLACGMQVNSSIPTPSNDVNIESPDVQIPVKVEITEHAEAAPIWITTGALNVRSEANADSTILGTLAPFTEIKIFITDISGDDCYLGEWYAITSPIEGYVCSLWVVRK